MDLHLSGRAAIITGGASGLGLETGRYLAREGASVLVADLHGDRVKAAVEELRGLGGKAEGVEVDVRRYEDMERMAQACRDAFGSIDILVAGAGVGGGGRFFMETLPPDWQDTIDINLNGVLNANRAVLPAMMEQQRGAIVNIASEAGKVGDKRMVVYSATKGGVIGFTKALCVEMGRYNIRANAVCPAITRTPMTAAYSEEQWQSFARFYPIGRLGVPQDIASMITFLVSDEASWVTGQAISVNGGYGRS